jgi:hypothetical protein
MLEGLIPGEEVIRESAAGAARDLVSRAQEK